MVTKLNLEILEGRATPSTLLGDVASGSAEPQLAEPLVVAAVVPPIQPRPDRVPLGTPDIDFEYGYEYGNGTGIGWAHGEYTAANPTTPQVRPTYQAPAAKSVFLKPGEVAWGITPLETATHSAIATAPGCSINPVVGDSSSTPVESASTPAVPTYYLMETESADEPWFNHIWVG